MGEDELSEYDTTTRLLSRLPVSRGGTTERINRRPRLLKKCSEATHGIQPRGLTLSERQQDGNIRCEWVGEDPLMLQYHDHEWGVELRDDRSLFELLILEGAQAGLSWRTILNKRENYRKAFDGFDPVKIARYREGKIRKLMADEGIVRNRLKIAATIQNAKCFLQMQKEGLLFSDFVCQFVDDRPIVNSWKSLAEIPAKTDESDAMSKALKKRGFKFVGSTICYAFMQAAGMVNDHVVDCYRYRALS